MQNLAQPWNKLWRENAGKRIYQMGCALLLLLSGPASQAASEPTLVLSDTYDIPYTTEAGDGFLDLVLDTTFRRAGLRMKLVKVSPERALLNANSGIEDGVSARIAGLEKNYPNLVRVPEKILDFQFVAFAQQSKLNQANWDTLAPITVGHIHGWKIFEQNLKPGTQTTIVDTAEQLFSMLERNRVDISLYERWMGLALAKKMHLKNIRVVEPPLAEREMFIYLNKRHADKIPAITAAIQAIKSEGFYTKLCREKFARLASAMPQCEVK